ncbi:hypothetical protein [Marinobacter sp. CHS3-4]|nr:hypothetical protein [Marinobacter sp. CHS3-4]MDI9246371.1 hypothetical protein [Marinobacter sp. CHS3-4]
MRHTNQSNHSSLAADPAKSLQQAFVVTAPFVTCMGVIASLPWIAG